LTVAERKGPQRYTHGWVPVGAPPGVASAEGGWSGARGGSGITAKAKAHFDSIAGKVHPRELSVYDVKAYERDHLEPVLTLTPGQAKAARAYTGSAFADVNARLRRGEDGGETARVLASAMKPIPHDLIVLREITGEHALDGVEPGDVIADAAFSSAALTPAGRFAGGRSHTTVMHILAPAGTPAVYPGQASEFPEDELILDASQPMSLMKAGPRPGRSDVTDAYFLVLPKDVAA
jgi:hypothetical protein